jgi:hypothetical protein
MKINGVKNNMNIKEVNMKKYMKILFNSLMFLFLAALFALPAIAALQAVGPISTEHGFPVWYQDTTGLALQPCLGLNADGTGLADPNCVLPLGGEPNFDQGLSISFPNNFPTEFFYSIADADAPKVGPAQVSLAFRYALEGAFTVVPAVGQQIIFLRTNLRVSKVGGTNGLVPNSVYTITHPFGIITCNTDLTGDITTCTDANGNGGGGAQAYRVEDGAFAPPLTPITAASFLGAPLTGFGPFLKAVAPAPPIGYIGNPAIAQTIQPGPNGAALTIAGPNIDPLNADGNGNANLLVVNNWFVAGKIAVIDTIPPVIGATTPAQVVVGATNVLATVSVIDNLFVGSVTIDLGPIGNNFVATLNGAQEVPATASTATGTGTFTIDTSANTFSFNISFSGLTGGAETAAHIHGPAVAGINAPAVFSLPLGIPKIGVWNYPEAAEADILAGRMYVNIHSQLFVGGEIRGQILPTSDVRDMVLTAGNRTNGTWGIIIPSATRAGTFNLPITASDGSNSANGVMTLSVVVSPLGAPSITNFAPISPVNDTFGAIRAFNITFNQTVNVTWYINGTKVFNQTNIILSTYTNTSAVEGTWNVTAIAQNANGTAMKTWVWIVTPIPSAGSISGFKINDTNRNRMWDAGEKGISNWTIRLIDITGIGKDTRVIRKQTFTDTMGFYRFDNLSAGKYLVIEQLKKGFVPTGSPVKRIKLAQGENSMNNNFTNRPIHRIHNIKDNEDIVDNIEDYIDN